MDLLQRQGHYPVPSGAPRTLGVEFSGVVESLGPEPERDFKVGDEVFGLAYGGSYPFLSFPLSPLSSSLLQRKKYEGREDIKIMVGKLTAAIPK